MSRGELYTIVTNKKAKGKKGSLVAIVAGTKTEQVIEQVSKINPKKRQAVIEITLDMANSMKSKILDLSLKLNSKIFWKESSNKELFEKELEVLTK